MFVYICIEYKENLKALLYDPNLIGKKSVSRLVKNPQKQEQDITTQEP